PTTALVMHKENTEPPTLTMAELDTNYMTNVDGLYLIGEIAGKLKQADSDEKAQLSQEMESLKQRPSELKEREQELESQIRELEVERDKELLHLPQPADDDVPVGASAEENVPLELWAPEGYDLDQSFAENRGFEPRSHDDLMREHGWVDFERGVKVAGSRSYVLRGDGMRLHQAVLQFGFDFMTREIGFEPVSVPVLVRDQMMTGTGFFPHGREQAYEIANPTGEGYDLYLTGTGEVGLMGLHADEILDADDLPRRYTTVSTCFRREAGSAGKDTAGLYRIHQFDKVEQVVICRADEQESRRWHQEMIGYVRTLLERLELPYRLLQCCTGDLGPKNADMIDIECWMPSRGEVDDEGRSAGDWGETHSASRLYDYQCRRLNTRYRDAEGENVVCHSLNNTVLASPRILVPLIEMHQQADGSVRVPPALQPYLAGAEHLGS
ncbi:MAG: serine--tRNA ligase, partial [Phycisphaeraceae bacterium]|nr:serine--tRNA ligase [Phycisphaeraceae bacterium]